jgi:hypothetical protein
MLTYLPLVFVFGDSAVSGPPEHVSSHVVVRPLRFGVDDGPGWILLASDGFQKLYLYLSELHPALVVSDLVSKADLHGGVIIVALIVVVLFQL